MHDHDDATESTMGGRALPSMAVRPRLQMACASDTPASLLPAHMILSSAARMVAMSADGVVLEIPSPPETTLLGSTAAITFPSIDGTSSFVSEVTAVDERPDGSVHVTVATPDTILAGNRRAAVRVPVPPDTVEATLVLCAARGKVKPIDISLGGLLVELDPLRAQSLEVGSIVSVRLAFEPIALLVDAEVRRREGRRFGLLFVTDIAAPPPELSKIMWKLQRTRLPSR